MNKKLIGAVLGTLVIASPALAEAPKAKPDASAAKGSEKGCKADMAAKGSEKGCKADMAAKGSEKGCKADAAATTAKETK